VGVFGCGGAKAVIRPMPLLPASRLLHAVATSLPTG